MSQTPNEQPQPWAPQASTPGFQAAPSDQPPAYQHAPAYPAPAYQGPQQPYGLVAQPFNAYAPTAQAPYGIDPASGLPYSEKSKLVAGLLQIFLGGLGVGRFYLGNIGMGVAQIAVTVLTLGFGALWPLIDGIMLLAGSPRDQYGRPLRP